jgi:hypothetical protein
MFDMVKGWKRPAATVACYTSRPVDRPRRSAPVGM